MLLLVTVPSHQVIIFVQDIMNTVLRYLLALLLVGLSCARDGAISPRGQIRLPVYISRIPQAMKESGVSALRAFTSDILILAPIGVIGATFNKPESVAQVVSSGCKWGMRMSTYGATLAGVEQLCRSVRGVDDIYNRMFGSGVSSALGKREQGVLGVAQGFVSGAAFIYVLDRFLIISPKATSEPSTNENSVKNCVSTSTKSTMGLNNKWFANSFKLG